MWYNHEVAEQMFRQEWRKKLRFYRENGMTEAQIQEIYTFERAVFNSDRRYYEHCDDIRFDDSNPMFATEQEYIYNEQNWMDVLPPELVSILRQQPAEHLRAFYLYRICKYSQDDISAIMMKPQRTISFWIGKIAEIIENFKNDC